MEKDDEVKGQGNSLDFGARIYDPRIGRWLSIDPLFKKYPSWSPYNFVLNTPIQAIDPDGRDVYMVTKNGVVHLSNKTLLRTISGRDLLSKYAKGGSLAMTNDIYISSQEFQGDANTIARTYSNAQKYSIIKDGKISLDLNDKYQKNFSKLNELDVSKSKGKKIHLISINENNFNERDEYQGAETIHHEIKAHIKDYQGGNSEGEHEKYFGAAKKLVDGKQVQPVKKGSPSGIIRKELKDLKEKDSNNEK